MAVLLSEPEALRPRVFLRQAQDKLTLRRTIQVRLGFDFGFWIADLGFGYN
jgi:arylamine N-acetyltransferase